MSSQSANKRAGHLRGLDDEQRRELMNINLELHALCRLFDHASCDPQQGGDEVRRAYRDVAALLRPLCLRLDRLQEDLLHP